MLICAAAFAVAAQAQHLAPGSLLVASTKSHDPDFARSTVLLIEYDGRSAVGLMLNKPTDISASELLPQLKGKPLVVYAGGPVAIGIRGLLRSPSAPFFRVVTNKSELLQLISRGTPSSSFRLYAGYVGWTAAQLQSEISRGLWKVVAGSSGAIFGTPDPRAHPRPAPAPGRQ